VNCWCKASCNGSGYCFTNCRRREEEEDAGAAAIAEDEGAGRELLTQADYLQCQDKMNKLGAYLNMIVSAANFTATPCLCKVISLASVKCMPSA
jgi:hypothetical protein